MKCIGQQGEVKVFAIDALPKGLAEPSIERDAQGRWIISHSEKGHHHVIPGDCEVLEKPDAPAGMQVLYAIVKEPAKLIQSAANPHEGIELPPGVYQFRRAREFNPFLKEARRVAD